LEFFAMIFRIPLHFPAHPTLAGHAFRATAVAFILSLATVPTRAADSGGAPASTGQITSDEHATSEAKLTPEAIKRYGVVLGTAKKVKLTPTFTVPARVAFNAEAVAQISSAVTGRVVELKVRQGDSVKAGDPLLVIESPELGESQSDYLQKRTAVETAVPAVELAKSAYDRAKALYEQNQGITLTELQRREGELRAAEGALQTGRAALTAAGNKLQLLGMDDPAIEALQRTGKITPRYVVRASIAGQVIARSVTLGELVRPEKESLMVLANMDTLWVLADVPEARTGELTPGALARVDAVGLRDGGFEGKVTYIAPTIDETTRTAQVRIEVQRGGAPLKPGQFARARIQAAAPASSAAAAPVLAVPEEAVQTMDGGPVVFVPVKGEEGTFAKRPVKLGELVGGMVPVLSGLTEGDPVVVGGTFVLKAELGKGAGGDD
jgi:cobalt-zinc-cadmium efflux system membrane fusion protein